MNSVKMLKFMTYCLLVLLCFLCGCWPGADLIGSYERDVSNKKALWGGYAKGQKYLFLYDVFLQKDPPKTYESKIRMYAGVPPRELTWDNRSPKSYSAPPSTEAYMESPEQWPLIIGIMKAGTQIECTKVLGWGTLMWPMSHAVYATIQDGPYAGIPIDIHDLSYVCNDGKDNFVPYPNYTLLKKAPPDAGGN
jgi:hypothetical protein